MTRHRIAPFAAVALAALAWASAAAGPQSETPRVVPLPGAPAGPAILEVRHDAGLPLAPGATLHVLVRAAPGTKVSVRVGGIIDALDCPADEKNPGLHACTTVIPEHVDGPHDVRATARDGSGSESALSAPYPVVVRSPDPMVELNRINARMQTVYFDQGSGALGDVGRAAVLADAEIIKTHPGYPVTVEGHCDSAEADQAEELSARRAQTVAEELVRLGVPQDRITLVPLGAMQPISSSRNEDERVLNRRALVLLAPVPAAAAAPR